MFDAADEQVGRWVREILPDAELRLTPPAQQGDSPVVHLYLTEIRTAPAVRHDRRPPLTVGLCYLVVVSSQDPLQAHRWLGQLLFAAMENKRFEVDLQAITDDTWRAFGLVPQPAFLLRLPFSLDRPHEYQRVTKQPTIRAVPAVAFTGILIGPDEVPIAGARVTLAELGLNTTTDKDGRFRFAAVAPSSQPKRLRIHARGLEMETLAVPTSDRVNEPAIIRFTQLED
jgi:hypothetical protein